MQKTFTEQAFIICSDGNSTGYAFRVEPGTSIVTGQPCYEEFSSEQEWLTRIQELGIELPASSAPPVPPAPPTPPERAEIRSKKEKPNNRNANKES